MSLNKAYLNAGRINTSDEIYTPFYAVEPLLEFIPKDKVIWCPFDEKWSAFYQTFIEKGYKVICSSLSEGQDFFTYEPKEHWDIIVSNPPFSKKDKVLKRAYELKKPFALLLPVNSIQGKKRHTVFNNDIQMLVFNLRIDYHTCGDMQNYEKRTHFGSAFFCRNILPSKLELRNICKYERPLIK